MYRDLALSTEMTSLGMDLARTPWNALTNNFAEGLPTYFSSPGGFVSLVSTTDDIKQIFIFDV